MKVNLFSLVFSSIFLFAGCINEDFDNTFSNIELTPEYSLPLGSDEYTLQTDFSGHGSSIPGSLGTIYFDDIPYPLYPPAYFLRDEIKSIDLDLNVLINDHIESFAFHVYIKNSYPTDITSQIYLLNDQKNLIDSVFPQGPLFINGAQINASGRVTHENIQTIDVSFKDRLAKVKQTKYYSIHSIINAQKQGIDTVRFYSTSKVVLNTGARIKFHYMSNEL
jgi:hypothetical protein